MSRLVDQQAVYRFASRLVHQFATSTVRYTVWWPRGAPVLLSANALAIQLISPIFVILYSREISFTPTRISLFFTSTIQILTKDQMSSDTSANFSRALSHSNPNNNYLQKQSLQSHTRPMKTKSALKPGVTSSFSSDGIQSSSPARAAEQWRTHKRALSTINEVMALKRSKLVSDHRQ